MRDLKVVKKNGSIEPFSVVKLIESCRSMGISKKLAKKIAKEVSIEVHKVQSSQIRELLLKIVRKWDPKLADKMIQYDMRKKEAETFIPIP